MLGPGRELQGVEIVAGFHEVGTDHAARQGHRSHGYKADTEPSQDALG
ncbi:hypothetical protein BN844_1272 [Pseudomonas sp. SHC52]|nr:hypothetical protein BN844_1272 [Pseudomonas sp. SHC52]